MAGPDSWMPVYWADLWNKTRDLNAVEQCAYYNLLGSMWCEGGSLPNDNDRLQRMSRVTEKEWRTVNATVTAYFDLGEDGRLYQSRLSEEYAKAMKAYTARSEHMRNVNSKRQQSPSTVTVPKDHNVTHNSQSPDGEKVGRKRPASGSRIQSDWQPNERNLSDAAERGYGPGDIRRIAEHFRDHHLSKGTVSKIWDASWRTWLANEKRFAPRAKATRTDWDGAHARGAGNVGDIGAAAGFEGTTIDGEFSSGQEFSPGQSDPIPASRIRPEAMDEGLRDAERGAGSGFGDVPKDSPELAGGSAGARGRADHNQLEMGREATAAGRHSGDGERGIKPPPPHPGQSKVGGIADSEDGPDGYPKDFPEHCKRNASIASDRRAS